MPQVGDTVVYLTQAHKVHDEYIPNASQPWTHPKWNGHWGMLCKVLSVEYQFPPSTTEGTKSIICKVDLKAMEGIVGGRRTTEYVNGIHKRPLPVPFTFHVYVGEVGQPDFLVLEKRFFKAINANLGLVGATVHIPYTEAVYRATVEGRSAKDKIHTHSPYSSLRVRFDTNEVEYVSPWEIVLENNGSNRSGLFRKGTQLKQLIDGVDSMIALEKFLLFVDQVDEEEFPTYPLTVAYPCWLRLIRSRLRHGYYRTYKAIARDVDAIYEAASKFNSSGSAVTRYARELRDKLRKIIAHVEASIPFDVDHRGEARMASDRAGAEKGGDGMMMMGSSGTNAAASQPHRSAKRKR